MKKKVFILSALLLAIGGSPNLLFADNRNELAGAVSETLIAQGVTDGTFDSFFRSRVEETKTKLDFPPLVWPDVRFGITRVGPLRQHVVRQLFLILPLAEAQTLLQSAQRDRRNAMGLDRTATPLSPLLRFIEKRESDGQLPFCLPLEPEFGPHPLDISEGQLTEFLTGNFYSEWNILVRDFRKIQSWIGSLGNPTDAVMGDQIAFFDEARQSRPRSTAAELTKQNREGIRAANVRTLAASRRAMGRFKPRSPFVLPPIRLSPRHYDLLTILMREGPSAGKDIRTAMMAPSPFFQQIDGGFFTRLSRTDLIPWELIVPVTLLEIKGFALAELGWQILHHYPTFDLWNAAFQARYHPRTVEPPRNPRPWWEREEVKRFLSEVTSMANPYFVSNSYKDWPTHGEFKVLKSLTYGEARTVVDITPGLTTNRGTPMQRGQVYMNLQRLIAKGYVASGELDHNDELIVFYSPTPLGGHLAGKYSCLDAFNLARPHSEVWKDRVLGGSEED